ncbi:MAG: response regulator [Erysipelotrichaceae bacterium]|nr:response regulator [Erysipelotrichaceae bacterium]
MPTYLQRIKKSIVKQDNYFNEYLDEITKESLSRVKSTSQVVSVVYLVFQLLSLLLYKSFDFRLAFLVPVILIACFYPLTRYFYIKGKKKIVAKYIPTAMQLVLALFLISTDTLVSPEYSAIYTPLFIIVSPVIFYLPYKYELTLNTLTYITFLLATFAYVNPKHFEINILQSTASYVVCFVILGIIVNMRFDKFKDAKYIEEIQSVNEQLNKAKKDVEKANKAKTDFLFSMSHDIRTPMNAIIGYAGLMENNFDDKQKSKEYLNKLKGASDILLSIINNVLEMARIESGKISLNEQVYASDEVYDEIVNLYTELMKKKGITFNYQFKVNTPFIYLDKVKLNEILLNLVSNAYKYTPEGGKVELIMEEIPNEINGYTTIVSTISDSGIGMSEEFLPTIFEEFTRETTTTDSKIEGTGLGMPIVKKLVELMGGSLSVESKLHEGTTFKVSIPHKIATEKIEENKESAVDENQLANKRILIAEDNELNREIIYEILKPYGALIELVQDGVECIESLKNHPLNHYDLVLMDIQMPNMNGYEATKNIRLLEDKYFKEIPIIAMTANAFEEDKKNAMDAGMSGHVSKPIDIAKLMSVLAEVINK